MDSRLIARSIFPRRLTMYTATAAVPVPIAPIRPMPFSPSALQTSSFAAASSRHERMMMDVLRWQQSITENLIDVLSPPSSSSSVQSVQTRESLERIIAIQGHVQQYLQHIVAEMKILETPSVPREVPRVVSPPPPNRASTLSPHARPFTPPPPRFSPKTLSNFITPPVRPIPQPATAAQLLPPRLSALARQPYVPSRPSLPSAVPSTQPPQQPPQPPPHPHVQEPGQTLEDLIQDQQLRLNQLLENE